VSDFAATYLKGEFAASFGTTKVLEFASILFFKARDKRELGD